jgi:hypothetical protein
MPKIDVLQGVWMKNQLSIPEQVATLDQVFLLRKKFFVNDANVDQDDPVQLHLVYCQVLACGAFLMSSPGMTSSLECTQFFEMKQLWQVR